MKSLNQNPNVSGVIDIRGANAQHMLHPMIDPKVSTQSRRSGM
jgi:hypothetical protein